MRGGRRNSGRARRGRCGAPWAAHVPALDCACASEQEKFIKNAYPGPVNRVETCCCAASSELQLSSELEVWEALSLWVNYSLPDRKGDVAQLLGSCLRLQDMDVLQLQQLRQTPLVRGGNIPGQSALGTSRTRGTGRELKGKDTASRQLPVAGRL